MPSERNQVNGFIHYDILEIMPSNLTEVASRSTIEYLSRL